LDVIAALRHSGKSRNPGENHQVNQDAAVFILLDTGIAPV
jgi:hypothetical protein